MSSENGIGFAPEQSPSTGQPPRANQWLVRDEPGQLQWVPKAHLLVDKEYQRTRISDKRVLGIAREWSWVACGVLVVARRPDNTLWVIDGQHRKLGADKRADIHALPCMVFDIDERKDEAKNYLVLNTFRGPPSAIDRFGAQVCSEDAVALAVKAMVEDSGYRIVRGGGRSTKCIAFVGTLIESHRTDADTAKAVWNLCVLLHPGEPILDRVYIAFFYLARFLRKSSEQSLFDKHNIETLTKAGPERIRSEIQKASAYFGKGGEKVYAEGVVNLLNHKRSTRRVPSVFSGKAAASAE